MKKILAILLAAIMAFSCISLTAFAKVDNEDKIVDELLNGEYTHVKYVVDKKYFKTELGVYTGLSLYDNAWDNFFTGSVDTDYAKTILLALIDRFEAEYNNETFEEIMKVLGAAKNGAEVIQKIDSYTGILDLAQNATWAKSLTIVNAALKIMNMSNKLYEQYVEAYAVILSCQAASVYYGDLLDYLAANVNDKNVKAAATELKENITKELDKATGELIAELAATVGKDGASIAIDTAMSTNTVTSVISTVYNTIGSIGNKLFNTKDKYFYMSSLAMLVKMENVLPAYVSAVLAKNATEEDELAADFALSSLLTMRQTGENMMANLGNVTEDAIAEKLISTVDLRPTIKNASICAAKLDVYSKIMKLDEPVKVTSVYTSSISKFDVVAKDSEGVEIARITAAKDCDFHDANGYYFNTYNSLIKNYIQVVVSFADGVTVAADVPVSDDTNTEKKGFAALLQDFFNKIAEFFRRIFGIKK